MRFKGRRLTPSAQGEGGDSAGTESGRKKSLQVGGGRMSSRLETNNHFSVCQCDTHSFRITVHHGPHEHHQNLQLAITISLSFSSSYHLSHFLAGLLYIPYNFFIHHLSSNTRGPLHILCDSSNCGGAPTGRSAACKYSSSIRTQSDANMTAFGRLVVLPTRTTKQGATAGFARLNRVVCRSIALPWGTMSVAKTDGPQ